MKMVRNALRFSLLFSCLTWFMASCDGEETESPAVEFQSDVSEVAEGSTGTVLFSIPLPASTEPIFTIEGTAQENTDYTYTITDAGMVFTVIDDKSYDPSETVIITLTGFSKGATVGVKKTHTMTITEAPLSVEFQNTSATRIEGQSIVAIFNQPLPAEVVPAYRITGTAQTTDYTATLNANGFVVAVQKDQVYDNNETIIIEMTTISGNALLAGKKTFTITITDEDESAQPGLRVDLTWEALDMTTSDVDVDLLVWRETSPGVFTAQGGLWSAIIGTSPESTFIPSNETDGQYALSYVYYKGSSDNLKIKAEFRSYKGNINETSNRASFSKTYSKANINTYSDPYNEPLAVAQRFDKVAANYLNLSDILVPTSGSRTGPITFILDDEAIKMIEAKRKQRFSRDN